MTILALGPYEALGAFTGLEIMGSLRLALPWLPLLIVLFWTYRIVASMKGQQGR